MFCTRLDGSCLRTRRAAVLPWQVAVCAVGIGMLPQLVSRAQKVFLGADSPLDISCPDPFWC